MTPAGIPKLFYGAGKAGSTSPAAAAVIGPEGVFFNSILSSSQYVELYDGEVGIEPWRRGVATEKIPSSALGKRLKSLVESGTFPCLAGYEKIPAVIRSFLGRGTLFLAPARDEAVMSGEDIVLGLRRGKGGSAGADIPARAIAGARERGAAIPLPLPLPEGEGRAVVIDPLVMDPSLFRQSDNIEPGGLTWYDLTGLVGALIERRSVPLLLIFPRRLPAGDPYPSFVLARLVSKVLAHALANR